MAKTLGVLVFDLFLPSTEVIISTWKDFNKKKTKSRNFNNFEVVLALSFNKRKNRRLPIFRGLNLAKIARKCKETLS